MVEMVGMAAMLCWLLRRQFVPGATAGPAAGPGRSGGSKAREPVRMGVGEGILW